MEFTVEFDETADRHSPVRELLLKLKDGYPDDFAAVLAGLNKLCNRQYCASLPERRINRKERRERKELKPIDLFPSLHSEKGNYEGHQSVE